MYVRTLFTPGLNVREAMLDMSHYSLCKKHSVCKGYFPYAFRNFFHMDAIEHHEQGHS